MADDEKTLADSELLSRAIKASGKSVRRFAREELVREPRTVWRWLSGPQLNEDGSVKSTNALPLRVREFCQAYLAEHPLPPDANTSAPLEEEGDEGE